MGQAAMSGRWCANCGNPILYGQVRMRETLVHVVVYELWWKFRPGRFKHYRKEPFCPGCDAREEEAARQKRGWGWGVLLAVGAVIFGWMYVNVVTGLVGAVVVLGGGWVVRRKKKVEVLPVERGQYGR